MHGARVIRKRSPTQCGYLASHGANPGVWNQPNKTWMDSVDGSRRATAFGNFKAVAFPRWKLLLEVMKAQHVPIKEYQKTSASGGSSQVNSRLRF